MATVLILIFEGNNDIWINSQLLLLNTGDDHMNQDTD